MTSAATRVLLVEDDPAAVALVRELLDRAERPIALQVCADLRTAREQLRAGGLDCVLLELNLPDSQGLATLLAVREATRTLPVIVLTDVEDDAVAREALAIGAEDYLAKGTLGRRSLLRALQYAVLRARFDSALRESEERYRGLVDNAPDVIFTYDLGGRFTSVNRAGEILTGYTRGELCGMGVFEVVDAEDAYKVRSRMADALAGGLAGALEPLELKVRTKDGRIIQLETHSRVVFWGGAPAAIEGVGRDLTWRKQAEAELAASAERYRELVENASDIIYTHDLDWRFTSINRAGERITGYTREEALRLRVSELLLPGYEQVVERHLAAGLQGGKLPPYELPIVAKDGQVVWLEVGARLLFDAHGPAGVEGVARDITARKSAEEQLRRSEERYRELFERNPTPLYVGSPDGTLRDCNAAFVQYFGFASRAEALATPTTELYADLAERGPLMEHLLREGANDSVEIRFRRRDGEILWGIKTERLLPDRDGGGDAMVIEGAVVDVTHRKRAERALELSERVYREMVEGSQGLIATHDLEGRFLSINAGAARALGYEPEQLIGRSLGELLAPEAPAAATSGSSPSSPSPRGSPSSPSSPSSDTELARYLTGLRQEGVLSGLMNVSTASGEVRVMSFHNRLVAEPGQPVYALAHGQDVTDRVGAALKVRDSEAALRWLHDVFGASLGFAEKLTMLLSEGAERFRMGMGAVMEVDGTRCRVVANGPPGARPPVGTELDHADTLCSETLHRGRVVAIEDIDASELSGHRARTQFGVRSYLAAPLTVEGQLWGVLSFIAPAPRPRPFASLDLEVVALMAELLSAEIERDERERETRSYAAIGDRLQACATIDEAVAVLGESVRGLFPRQQGIIALGDGMAGLRRVACWGALPAAAAGHAARPAPPLQADSCWAAQTRRAHAYRGGGRDPRDSGAEGGDFASVGDQPCPHFADRPELASTCVPILAAGELLGVLSLRARDPGGIRRHLRQLASAVADRAGASLANLQLRDSLRAQAIRDPLTGLFNRRYMEETLEREVTRAGRRPRQLPLGLIMCDLDDFKAWNDSHGHQAGDALLRAVAQLLSENVRGEDIVCRYGGEEFVLILPEATLEMTRERADRLCRAARALMAPIGGAEPGRITISLGVAAFPEHGPTGDSVLRAADRALYRAKAEGRDRVVVAG